MNLFDQILNLAALLLWLCWRSAGLMPGLGSSVLSLASTLKKAEPKRPARVLYLVFLVGLLGIRSVVYWHLGKGIQWTPSLDLLAISLPFRSDDYSLMLLFSLLGFGMILATFYSWLLLISVVNRKVADSEPLQKLVRLHLGGLERLPTLIKLLLPMISAILLWSALSSVLARFGIAPSPISRSHLWQQALLLGLASVLVWKLLLIGILFLHLLNSYVYLGNAPFFNFSSVTARNLLGVLARLPLRIGKVDLTPLVGVALVLALAQTGSYWLPRLYQKLPL